MIFKGFKFANSLVTFVNFARIIFFLIYKLIFDVKLLWSGGLEAIWKHYLFFMKKNDKNKNFLNIIPTNVCFQFFQFEAELRRWSMRRAETRNFEEFYKSIETLYLLKNLQFLISYIDPRDNDLLPINNDDNFGRAISKAKPLLRLIIQRKGKYLQIITKRFKFYLI